ncbi:MAG: DUF3135 domain-containing protein [Oceanospirillales bacterium]|nr:MAG: DUF3135 domain-containing protein [Oceanospirillales bacterium]
MANIIPSINILPPFEELAFLARHDTEEFEVLRKEIIATEIAMSRSNQLYLERLQFRLDGIFRKHKNPYTRCQLLLSMILESSHKISNGIDTLMESSVEIDDLQKRKLSIVK